MFVLFVGTLYAYNSYQIISPNEKTKKNHLVYRVLVLIARGQNRATVSLLAGPTISRLPEHESNKPVPSPPFPQLTATTKLKKNSTYFTKLVPHPILNE